MAYLEAKQWQEPKQILRLWRRTTTQGQSLFCFVLFEERSGFFEGEGVSVDDQFVFACVFRDVNHAADGMAMLAEGLDDQIDVYHG